MTHRIYRYDETPTDITPAKPAKPPKLRERNLGPMRRTIPKGFVITQRRDLLSQPLTPKEFLRQPCAMRSRWLITGYAAGESEPVTFYLGSPAELRVGLYEPGARRPKRSLPRSFGPSVAERQLLVDVFALLAKKGPTQLAIRVYCDGLQVVR